jgi:hypothetical protein
MDFILRAEIDGNLTLTGGPVGVDGVQQHGAVFRRELRDVPPLAASEPLEDEKEDEHKGKLLEETIVRRENAPFPVDPRDPQMVVWKARQRVVQCMCVTHSLRISRFTTWLRENEWEYFSAAYMSS